MARLERLVQINVALLVALGTVLFAMEQQNVHLPVLVGFAAITSVIFTDGLKWFHLHRSLANLLALLVAVYTLHDFFYASSEEKLLSIANLLAYLQLVLFYEQKTIRVYWHLIVLSLLQVVVAAALDFGFAGAVLLAAYVLATVTAMTLLYLLYESLAVDASSREMAPVQQQAGPPLPAAESGVGPTALALLRFPFRTLLRHNTALVLAAAAVGMTLFYTLPRHGRSFWTGPIGPATAQVGFQPEVDLDETGQIYESDDLVMRIAFYDRQTNAPYPVFGEPYIRGAVLTRYRPRRDRTAWLLMTDMEQEDYEDSGRPRLPAGYWQTGTDRVREEVLLEPGAANWGRFNAVLFSVFPMRVTKETRKDVWYDPQTRQLTRFLASEFDQEKGYRYFLDVYAFKNGLQMRATPYPLESNRIEMPAWERAQLLQYPRRRLAKLKEFTDQLLRAAGVSAGNTLQTALMLENHFLTGGYTYTLNFRRVQRDYSLDPVADFVLNHRSGHCEYFASALALMLRTQGIPSRVVVGFKGGDFNPVGHYYHVKQLHAHAWVEAYLEPEELNERILGFMPEKPTGAWLRLDPTPPYGKDDEELALLDLVFSVRHWIDYAQVVWGDYVIGLNRQRQEQMIYQPLQQRANDSYMHLLDATRWLKSTARGDEDEQEKAQQLRDLVLRWLACTLAVIVVLVGGVSLAFIWLGRGGRGSAPRGLLGRVSRRLADWTPLWISRWMRLDGQQVRARPVVPFYLQMVQLLARHGFRRPPEQTQRRFAEQLQQRLASSPPQQPVAELPAQLVWMYYRVRFGQQQLSDAEHRAVEAALTQLDAALTGGKDSNQGTARE